MKEHLATEDNFREQCIYCGRSMEDRKWQTLHHREVLYKITHCECGKKAMIKMPFFGSGHDSWSKHSMVFDKPEDGKRKTSLRTLESKVKILSAEK